MNWIESIKAIREAQQSNRLVIFVGAGVSRNSGIPTWAELVKELAKNIKYDKCLACKNKETKCPYDDCEMRYTFSQAEILRIPEYLYLQDESENHKAYYNLISDNLGHNAKSNPIDDEIFRLLPHHIITTNFDGLLESSHMINRQLYAVAARDKDLLTSINERFIIKMHGDIDAPETIVLKESDYLNYEQQHPLISTFIRALLVNHTFLFLGYGLNDYNLNLIIGWINYFREYHAVEHAPRSFLICSAPSTDYELLRLESKNIYAIDLSSLPETLLAAANIPLPLDNQIGRRLFSYLRCITDSKLLESYIPLSDIIREQYSVLKSYNRISYDDLIHIYSLGCISFVGKKLEFIDKDRYEQIRKLIDDNDSVLIDTLQRTGVTHIYFLFPNVASECTIPPVDYIDCCFQQYLDNDYVRLSCSIKDSKDIAQKIYYSALFKYDKSTIDKLVNQEAESLVDDDYISFLLHKMRARMALITLDDRQVERADELEKLFETRPLRYRQATRYLEMFFHSMASNIKNMEDLLEKQELRNQYDAKHFYSGHSHQHIWNLQSYAYDYYFFFKFNYLPVDGFTDPKKYLAPYLKAILCSYMPTKSPAQKSILSIETHHMVYPINEIDLDMFVKYSDADSLRGWIKKYSVHDLEVMSDVNVIRKFKKLCMSYEKKPYVEGRQIYCFIILLCLMQPTNTEGEEIFETLLKVFIALSKTDSDRNRTLDLLEPILYMLESSPSHGSSDKRACLLDCLLQKEEFSILARHKYRMLLNVIRILSDSATADTRNRILSDIDQISDSTQHIQKAYEFQSLLPNDYFRQHLQDTLTLLPPSAIFMLLVENAIPYSEAILDRFICELEKEVKERKRTPAVKVYPDNLGDTLNCCLFLVLLGHTTNLERLAPFAAYSEHLRFMLNPATFDYSSIDTRHWMWQNLIRSESYRSYFIEHKTELLTDDLKMIWERELETREQQKIVYGILLSDDELFNFGKKR